MLPIEAEAFWNVMPESPLWTLAVETLQTLVFE